MIYLLHSDVRLGGAGSSGAQHYLGFAHDERIVTRLWEHIYGASTPAIVRAFRERGANLEVVALWPNGQRALERYLKRLGHLPQRCYICMGRAAPPELASLPAGIVRPREFSFNRRAASAAIRLLDAVAEGPGAPTPLAGAERE